ncbi:MAG TPA: AAA family ATPase [Symbiobacteriaceae bacterium]|jgi:hypothetical protein
MHRLTIHNFGPVKDATIDVNRFLVLIGPQSSGKSTIAKLVYFFLHVRDEVMKYAVDCAQDGVAGRPDHELTKLLRHRFVEFFGPSRQPADVKVTYDYGDGCSLQIALDPTEHRYVTPRFSSPAWKRILSLVKSVQGQLVSNQQDPHFFSAVGKVAADLQRAAVLARVRDECRSIFSYEKELFFVPAGRTLLSTLADQIQNIHPQFFDFPMHQFVDAVNQSKSFFDKPMQEIVRERLALSTEKVDLAAVNEAQSYVRKILKGEYMYDREGGKLYISDNVYTKINYASSGQQESVWILLSLFLLVLQRSRSLVVVEEPEAHLYPIAQKQLLEYVAFVYNTLDCDFVLTTHSPYVLSCVNNLISAHDLSRKISQEKLERIIPRSLWLNTADVGGYFVNDGTVEPLMATDSPALKTELVDSASDLINADFEAMLELESEAASK